MHMENHRSNAAPSAFFDAFQQITGFETPRTDTGWSRSVPRVRGKRASQPEIPAEVQDAPRCLRHRSGVA